MSEDAEAALARAVAHDREGREADAIPAYRAAIAAGLPDELDVRARIGLASSLRETGEVDEAVRVHAELAARSPELAANRLFLALALAADGAAGPALAEAITVAVALGRAAGARDVIDYAPALGAYAESLRDAG